MSTLRNGSFTLLVLSLIHLFILRSSRAQFVLNLKALVLEFVGVEDGYYEELQMVVDGDGMPTAAASPLW